jgi:diphosphomevalonate decarboxylase
MQTDQSTTVDDIFIETVSAPTNIACIKYWGKANVHYNTPINSSLSVTLHQDDLCSVTTVAASRNFTSDRLWINGEEDESASSKTRFRACVDGVKKLAMDLIDPNTQKVLVKKDEWNNMYIHVSSYNTFPTAAGLASSAAGYAALVYALAKLFCAVETYPGELSAIARQGSGSACRSLYGGFVAWRMGGKKDDWSDSIAEQVASEDHWPEIRVLICVVSDAKKDTSSTSGMETSVATSSLLQHRSKNVVPERMRILEESILNRDFDAFGKTTMMDSNQFHATCLDTYPPIFYMNDTSKNIIKLVHAYNDFSGEVRAAYTFDAGPNAVIYTLEKYVVELGALITEFFSSLANEYINDEEFSRQVMSFNLDASLVIEVQKHIQKCHGDIKKIYFTKSGPGPRHLGKDSAIIDTQTGLNVVSL